MPTALSVRSKCPPATRRMGSPYSPRQLCAGTRRQQRQNQEQAESAHFSRSPTFHAGQKRKSPRHRRRDFPFRSLVLSFSLSLVLSFSCSLVLPTGSNTC